MPLAVAARNAGHDVAVCCSPAFAEQITELGLHHLPGGAPALDDFFRAEGAPIGAIPAKWVREEIFAKAAPNRFLPDLASHVAAWCPDVIVRESLEFAGCLLAEKLGLPHAAVATGSSSARDDERLLFTDALSVLRRQHGLSPDPDGEMMSRYLLLSLMPPSWDGAEAVPKTLHFIRYETPPRAPRELPAHLNARRDRPLVLAALGTVFHTEPSLFETIIEALGDLPVDVVGAIGRDQDPARLGVLPRNVRVERWLPQVEVLAQSALFVTHGGFNSAKEALSQGVPLVVVPIGADQHYTAARVEALGLGRTVRPAERGAATIRSRAREVLVDARFTERAARFAAEMAGMPPLTEAVRLLERLARDHTPIIRAPSTAPGLN